MAEIEVKGLRELGEALKNFGPVLAKKYLRRATYEAAKVIEADAESRAPVRTGTLKSKIAIFRRKSDENSAMYAVGVRPVKLSRKVKKVLRILRKANGTRTSIDGDAFYWRFLEFGTAKMAARPFLRPAFEAQKAAAIDAFAKSLADGVEKASLDVAGNRGTF